MLDRLDQLVGEQLREQPHHHAPVLEHVGHPGGHAQVVFEHVVLACAGAHDVDPGDVGVDAAGHVHALHLAPVLRVGQHPLGRDAAGANDVLVVVNVVQKAVERLHPLLEPALEQAPFASRNDARHDVEGDQPFGAGVLAVDGKSDADAVEGALGFLALLGDLVGRGALEPVRKTLVVRPQPAVGGAHFIINGTGHSGLIEDSVQF